MEMLWIYNLSLLSFFLVAPFFALVFLGCLVIAAIRRRWRSARTFALIDMGLVAATFLFAGIGPARILFAISQPLYAAEVSRMPPTASGPKEGLWVWDSDLSGNALYLIYDETDGQAYILKSGDCEVTPMSGHFFFAACHG